MKIASEFFGTAALLVVIVGSGIAGETLSQGNLAVALLANSIATGAGLCVLIQCLSPISGAHLNPAVSLVAWLHKELSKKEFALYVVSQVFGAIFGVFITHLMFGQSVFQLSIHDRSDLRFLLSEAVATVGLISVILLLNRRKESASAPTIALYITAAYWCTSSTSFANPAVTIARCLTNTFSGILWKGVPGFVAVQIFCALGISALRNKKLFRKSR